MKKADFLMFGVGAFGYGLIEIIWRGFTHPSMLTAGGICFISFAKIGKKMRNASIILKALVGSGLVTLIELVFGIIFNVILRKNVWDYSNLPLNFKGQICFLYSFFWGILSIIFIPFATKVNNRLQNSN